MENQMINLKCRKCGAVVSADQKKCPKCGAPILIKVMMEEEKRHLSAKEIREKDKRMRKEYEKISKEKEARLQKAEKRKQLSEEKKEKARIKASAELAAIREKEEEKAAKITKKTAQKEERQKAKEEKVAACAKKKADKLSKKEKKSAAPKGKTPVWVIILVSLVIVAIAAIAVFLLTRPDSSAPVITENAETVTPIEEEPQEEIEEAPPAEEIAQEPQEEAPAEEIPAKEENPQESKPTRNITRNNYLFPSDTQYLTESDLNGLSKFDTGLIRNEIYAKKGYVFKDEPYKSYFNSQAWYKPNPSAKMNLNETEKYNINFLLEYERSQGWR